MEADSDMIMVTPYNTASSQEIQDSRTWAEQQPLVSEDPGAEMVAPHDLSSTRPTVLPRSRPVAPGKTARLRAEALDSQHSHNNSTSDVSLTTSSANAAPESSGATSSYDPWRLHTEFESLRREVELLRTEGAAPPGYTEGDG